MVKYQSLNITERKDSFVRFLLWVFSWIIKNLTKI